MAVGGQGINDERPPKWKHGVLASLTIVMNLHVIYQQGDNAVFLSAPTPKNSRGPGRIATIRKAG